MHGLVNISIERFVCDTYGRAFWREVMQAVNPDVTEFEPMLSYDLQVTLDVMASLASALQRDQDEILEDIGTYLVSHPNACRVRRLLRFGGGSFVELLHSLNDLPARARLAVPDLVLPPMELREHSLQSFSLLVECPERCPLRFGCVMLGALRALADDYGALVMLDYRGGRAGREVIEIRLLHSAYAEGRGFQLGCGCG